MYGFEPTPLKRDGDQVRGRGHHCATTQCTSITFLLSKNPSNHLNRFLVVTRPSTLPTMENFTRTYT